MEVDMFRLFGFQKTHQDVGEDSLTNAKSSYALYGATQKDSDIREPSSLQWDSDDTTSLSEDGSSRTVASEDDDLGKVTMSHEVSDLESQQYSIYGHSYQGYDTEIFRDSERCIQTVKELEHHKKLTGSEITEATALMVSL